MKDVTEKVIEFLKEKKVTNKILLSARFFISENELFILSKSKFESDYIESKFQSTLLKIKDLTEFSEIRKFNFTSQLEFTETYSGDKKAKSISFPSDYILLLSLNPIFKADIRRIRKEIHLRKDGYPDKESFNKWFEYSLDQIADEPDFEKTNLFKLPFCINELCLRYGIPKEQNEEFIESLIFFDDLELVNNIKEYKELEQTELGYLFRSYDIQIHNIPKPKHVLNFLDKENAVEINLKIPISYCNYENIEDIFKTIREATFTLVKKMPRYDVRKLRTPFSYRDYLIFQIYNREHNSKKVQHILQYNYGISLTAENIRKVYQRTKSRVQNMISGRDT